jgi:hypothetical protein
LEEGFFTGYSVRRQAREDAAMAYIDKNQSVRHLALAVVLSVLISGER